MAVTFTTKANGDVTMLDANAKEVLGLIGKEFGTRGVITAGEAAAAAAKLRAAGSATRQQGQTEDDKDAVDGGSVPLHTRTQPFIEMLENAAARNKDILWGV